METFVVFFDAVYAAVLELYKGDKSAVVGVCFGFLAGLYTTVLASDKMPSLAKWFGLEGTPARLADFFVLLAITLAFVPVLCYRFPTLFLPPIILNGNPGTDVVPEQIMRFGDAAIAAWMFVLVIGISATVDNFSVLTDKLTSTIKKMTSAITKLIEVIKGSFE